MRRWILVLMLLVGTAAAYPVDGGWHRSDEPVDPNTTLIPQTTTRTVTHYHPMSELSDAERTVLVTPTPPPDDPCPIEPASPWFVACVVGVTGLTGLVLLGIWAYRRQKNGG